MSSVTNGDSVSPLSGVIGAASFGCPSTRMMPRE
jgi:hypothetical protein